MKLTVTAQAWPEKCIEPPFVPNCMFYAVSAKWLVFAICQKFSKA